jgi:hypothetical protein
MALLARGTNAGRADTTHLMKVPQISGDVYAGEALDAGACVYRKASDGLVYMSNGTAVAEAARFMGIVVRAVAAGQPVTIYRQGARIQYGTGLTIGALYYVAATAGRLDTAATTGGLVAVAEAISSTDIQTIVMRAGA